MDIKSDFEKVKELEQRYLSFCKVQCNSFKAIDAFHDWQKAMLVLFNNVVPADNEDFLFIKNKDASGSGFDLKNLYDTISGRYSMLMSDIEKGRFSKQSFNSKESSYSDIWSLIHPQIVEVSMKRMSDGYFADAVEAACKCLNSRVREIVLDQTGRELDGANLMRTAFSVNNPIIRIATDENKSGHDIQQGYMEIFSGVMIGIRNPKAHDNEIITIEDAYRKLIMISILMYKIDERIVVD